MLLKDSLKVCRGSVQLNAGQVTGSQQFRSLHHRTEYRHKLGCQGLVNVPARYKSSLTYFFLYNVHCSQYFYPLIIFRVSVNDNEILRLYHAVCLRSLAQFYIASGYKKRDSLSGHPVTINRFRNVR